MRTARRFKLELMRIHFIDKCYILGFIAMVIAFKCLWMTSKSINVTENKSYIHVCSPLNSNQFDLAIFILGKHLDNFIFYCGSYAGNPLLCTNSSTSCGLNPVQPLELASQPSGVHYRFNCYDQFSCHVILSNYL